MRKSNEKTQSVDNDSKNENSSEDDKKKAANQVAQASLLEEAWKKAGFVIVSVKPTKHTEQGWRRGNPSTPQVTSKTESGLDKVTGNFTITTKRGNQEYEYKHTHRDGKTYIKLPINLARNHNLSDNDKAEIKAFAKLSPGGKFTGTFSKAFAEEFINVSNKPADFSSAKIVDEDNKEYKYENEELSEVEKSPEVRSDPEEDSEISMSPISPTA